MKVFEKETNDLVVEIDIKTFLGQGGEETYSILFKEDNVEEIYKVRELVYEFTEQEISEAATSYIYKFYPIWKQVNIHSDGSEEEKTKMKKFIDSVKHWANNDPNLFNDSLGNIIP